MLSSICCYDQKCGQEHRGLSELPIKKTRGPGTVNGILMWDPLDQWTAAGEIPVPFRWLCEKSMAINLSSPLAYFQIKHLTNGAFGSGSLCRSRGQPHNLTNEEFDLPQLTLFNRCHLA